MDHRELVAHHEAAHAVLADQLGAGILEQGIDLDAPTSQQGAYGNAAVNIFTHNPKLSSEEQQNLLLRNLCVVLAGAVCDAKLKGELPFAALRKQRGDKKVALELLDETPLIDEQDAFKALKEKHFVLKGALRRAVAKLQEPLIWKMVQMVAHASLENGGQLSKIRIEQIIANVTSDAGDKPAD